MKISTEEFELPQTFQLEYNDTVVELSIKEAIKAPQKQQTICETINQARTYSGW